ncbi:MAG: helicase, partial [Chloroflexaceae bacterium]|nr:helicase [Chloroflexaceae bacterium]
MTRPLPLDIVRQLARQHMRGENSPLLWAETRPARTGERISHLPVQPALAQAWVQVYTAPFWRHQAQAHATLRRGEPVALTGDLTTTGRTLCLLLLDALLIDPPAAGVLLVPDAETAHLHLTILHDLAAGLTPPVPVVWLAEDTPVREAARARILITTPEMLHLRLLRHWDRAWQRLWSRLHYLALAHADSFCGVAAAHLAGLLLRTLRLAPSETLPTLLASLVTPNNADAMLAALSGFAWRTLAVADTPRTAQAVGVWQAGSERLREAAQLALTLRGAGYRVHLICAELERIPLLGHIGTDDAHLTAGWYVPPADVHIFVGYPAGSALLQHALVSPSSMCLVVLGNAPHERVIARQPQNLVQFSAPIWIGSPNNAYIARQHLLCAAAELPLRYSEVQAWHADEMLTRLERDQQLMRLPEAEIAWQPVATADDPYEPFDLHTIGTPAVEIYDEYQTLLDLLDPIAFDRWGFRGAALPPLRGGYRVLERDEERGTLTVRADLHRHKTLPLRHCEINVRDERDSRLMRGQITGVGRIILDETIYAYRETHPGGSPTEQTLANPLNMRWTAPAAWINLPLRLKATGQLIGWSVATAIALLTNQSILDCVPAYDAGLSRLYLVDAQPGGNGLSVWLFDHLEQVLPLAYDIALASRNDALFEPVARLDMDWLLALLGSTPTREPDPLLAASAPLSPEEELLRHRLSLPTVLTTPPTPPA